jgi:hypothetical protein
MKIMAASSRLGVIPIFLLALIAGCHSIGPGTINRDRVDYSTAMTDSWKSETLLNIVKMRYLDPPIFVDVGSIISGYSFDVGASASGTLYTGNSRGNSVTPGINGGYADHPTVTYVPLTGQNFLQSVVSPMPPESLFFAIQSGWPADVMLRMSLAGINGLKNEGNFTSTYRPASKEFDRASQLLRKLQLSGSMSLHIKKAKDEQMTFLTFRSAGNSPEANADIKELDALLELDPTVHEFRLVYGTAASDNHEIAVQTRSLLNVMTGMAMKTRVPAEDVASDRVLPGYSTNDDPKSYKESFVIQSSEQYPSEAFVAVRYRSSYFWIDDRDLASKRDFAFIMLLFTLSDTTSHATLPLITIPAQ